MTLVPGRRRTTPSVGLTLTLCVAVTVGAAFAPGIEFAYHAPRLHSALETAAALIASLAAFLVCGRFRRHGRLDDLLLSSALAILAFTNFILGAVPAAFSSGSLAASLTRTQLSYQLAGAALFAVAALVPGTKLRDPRGSGRAAILALCCLALIGVLGAVSGVFPGIPTRSVADGPARVESASLTMMMMFASMVAFSLAACGLYRRSVEFGDGMLGFVAAGATALTFARLDFFLYPSLDARWVYIADLMRLLAYALIAAGAAYEISSYWRSLSENAVLEERRRLARELHDGLAQELAHITRLARRLPEGGQQPVAIQMAASRALDESRRAIAALTRPLDEPLEVALRQSLEEIVDRWERPPTVTLWPCAAVDLDPERRDALIRISCEAVTNAIRHGHPSSVRVSVEETQGHVVARIVDDGAGFDVTARAAPSGRFGISSMRERIEALGGRFVVTSRPGAGTTVEVTV